MSELQKESFLERNKHFINLIMALATLISSVATAYIAKTIGEQQINAQKIQFAPIFTFNKIYDMKDGVYTTEYLTIENQGYPVLNFDAKLDTIIKMRRTIYQPKIIVQESSFPIDYYSGRSGRNGGKGDMTMFIGFENLTLGKKIQDDFVSYNQSHSSNEIINHETYTIVKISYIDALDEPHEKYFIDEKLVTKEQYLEVKKTIKNKPDLRKNDLQIPLLIKRLENEIMKPD
ncbi:hypothetical protein [Vibrio sp.]|uniref:hypothetical protein n=1 Tax=Vibrio sp. TaxID=678 RepID=UPI003AA8C110